MKGRVALLLVVLCWCYVEANEITRGARECEVAADCASKSCKVADCVHHRCVHKPVECPLPEDDACVYAQGCDAQTGSCVYEDLRCDDGDACTRDSCKRSDGAVPVCAHEPLEECDPDAFRHAGELTVLDATSLRVEVDRETSAVTFCHSSSDLGPDVAVMLSFEPHAACAQQLRGTCDNAAADLPRCAYFEGVPQANGWTVVAEEGVLTHCRTFALDELLQCHNYSDPYGRLFSAREMDARGDACEPGAEDCEVTYSGQLFYAATTDARCHVPDVCYENVLAASAHNVSVTVNAAGLSHAAALSSAADFEVWWMGNVWLGGADAGDLRVKLRTRTALPSRLCRAETDVVGSTGWPLAFENAEADCETAGDGCYQEWALRGAGALKYSGSKLLVWDLCSEEGARMGEAAAALDLRAVRATATPTTGEVDASLQLHAGGNRSAPQFAGEPLKDGEWMYGELCLSSHQHLDPVVREAALCYSTERDLVRFDPRRPESTGCNDAGADVQRLVLYSLDDPEAVSQETRERFGYAATPPADSWCDGFVLQMHATSKFAQTLQVTWFAQELGGAGGAVELVSEEAFPDGSRHTRRREHDDEGAEFHVHCADQWFWSDDHCDPFDGDWDGSATWFWAVFLGLVALFFACTCLCYWSPAYASAWSKPVAPLDALHDKHIHHHYHHHHHKGVSKTPKRDVDYDSLRPKSF